MSIFEKASRQKLRIQTDRGLLTVEDLWDLPLTGRLSLDSLAKTFHRRVREIEDETSFVPDTKTKQSAENESAQLTFDILKHIIEVRLQEREINRAAKEKAENRKKILELISKKQDEALSEKSIEELTALL